MDIKKEITTLLNNLDEELKNALNSGVIIHIDRAEHHFRQAKTQKDDQCYTDVIYRTNQAYEGMLKEVYCICKSCSECKLKTFELEDFFEKEKFFNERVKHAFTTYRLMWRNPSAHDHKLFFKRDEAFLAMVNVTAFIYILLNQVLEHISYKEILEKIDKVVDVRPERVYIDQISDEAIINLLSTFHEFPKDDIVVGSNMSQVIGALKGYLEGKLKGIEVLTEFGSADERGYRPDIMVRYNDKNLFIIEVKKTYSKDKLEFGYIQLKDYLFESNVKRGVIYFYTDKTDAEYEIIRDNLQNKEIITLKPKQKRKKEPK